MNAAASINETDALLLLGQAALEQGERDQAFDWFRAAARGGDARAINMLGRCHELGWGTAIDLELALRHYRMAAAAGEAWALFNLADLHLRGHGVDADEREAYALYTRAARLGLAKALNMLGMMHEHGQTPEAEADVETAAAFYQAAGDGGDCWGAFNRARLYLDHDAVNAALPWLSRAIDLGFDQAHAAMAEALAAHPDPRVAALARRAQAQARGECP